VDNFGKSLREREARGNLVKSKGVIYLRKRGDFSKKVKINLNIMYILIYTYP